jgi:phosphotransferase system IIB component
MNFYYNDSISHTYEMEIVLTKKVRGENIYYVDVEGTRLSFTVSSRSEVEDVIRAAMDAHAGHIHSNRIRRELDEHII